MNLNNYKNLVVIPSLSIGGAEKNMIWLSDNYSNSLLVILTNSKTQKQNCIYLNQKNTLCGYIKFLFILNKFRYEGNIITSLIHLNLYARLFHFLLPKKSKLIVREAAVLTDYYRKKSIKNYILKCVTRNVINSNYRTVCQSKDMLDDLVLNFGLETKRSILIYNPIDIKSITSKAKLINWSPHNTNYLNIIFVGRFNKQKNILETLNILSKVKREFNFYLIGYGVEESIINEKINELNLKKVVFNLGKKTNPYPYIRACDLFISTTLYEGSPNTFIESLALGTPVFSYNSPGGIEELLSDKKGCKLIENFNQINFIHEIENFQKRKYKYDLSNRSEKNTLYSYQQIL